ncbi:MAG: RNA polymerase sigma factor RpoE, partial [Methylococcaceae bacterium]|nr:RNA polymerase sigma factor RpoE [Methylococcaceae bacterium]
MSSHTKYSEQLDEDLVLRVQQGDRSAFDLLVIKYQHKIIQLVNRYV